MKRLCSLPSSTIKKMGTQLRAFNKKLARLSCFRIRNRIASHHGRFSCCCASANWAVRESCSSTDSRPNTKWLASTAHQYRCGSFGQRQRPKTKAKGVVLDFRGGWVIGNAQMNDHLNISIVKVCDVAVVSVDYRLVVSTPIEGVMQDCLTAARWLLSDDCREFANLPVIVVGESAGRGSAFIAGNGAWGDSFSAGVGSRAWVAERVAGGR